MCSFYGLKPYTALQSNSLRHELDTQLTASRHSSQLCRCRWSASPATGLVGMEENGFLRDFFGCAGFLPLTTQRCRVQYFSRKLISSCLGSNHLLVCTGKTLSLRYRAACMYTFGGNCSSCRHRKSPWTHKLAGVVRSARPASHSLVTSSRLYRLTFCQPYPREHGKDHVDPRSPTRTPLRGRSWPGLAAGCCWGGVAPRVGRRWPSHGPFNLHVLVRCCYGSPCQGQPFSNGEKDFDWRCRNRCGRRRPRLGCTFTVSPSFLIECCASVEFDPVIRSSINCPSLWGWRELVWTSPGQDVDRVILILGGLRRPVLDPQRRLLKRAAARLLWQVATYTQLATTELAKSYAGPASAEVARWARQGWKPDHFVLESHPRLFMACVLALFGSQELCIDMYKKS